MTPLDGRGAGADMMFVPFSPAMIPERRKELIRHVGSEGEG